MGSLREDFMEGMRQGLREQGQKLQTVLTDEVDTRGITNRGTLRQGWEQQLAATGTEAVLQITGVRYANYVAEGTKEYSAPPPKGPIRRWVQTKLNVPEPLVPSATFKIRRAIFEEGTPTSNSPLRGRNDYVRAALRRRLPDFQDALEDAIIEAAN